MQARCHRLGNSFCKNPCLFLRSCAGFGTGYGSRNLTRHDYATSRPITTCRHHTSCFAVHRLHIAGVRGVRGCASLQGPFRPFDRLCMSQLSRLHGSMDAPFKPQYSWQWVTILLILLLPVTSAGRRSPQMVLVASHDPQGRAMTEMQHHHPQQATVEAALRPARRLILGISQDRDGRRPPNCRGCPRVVGL